jgi:hypothetical protein
MGVLEDILATLDSSSRFSDCSNAKVAGDTAASWLVNEFMVIGLLIGMSRGCTDGLLSS